MDFGKLPNVDNIDFTLPSTPAQTWEVLAQHTADKANAKIYVGCPVWGEKEWVGKIYPRGAKPKEFLHYYSTQFNCIEMNTTHYNFPSEILVEKWKADVHPGFKFCPKINQQISHEALLQNTDAMVQEFCRQIVLLEDNLGPLFLQLPPNFSPQYKNVLINFLDKFPKQVPLTVELRHGAWFTNPRILEEVLDAMRRNNVGTVITDVAGRRDVLHQRLTAPFVIIRFGANDLHPTDFPRLEAWANLLDEWVQKGLKEAYFFLHTATRHLNLELATSMIEVLNKKGYNLKPPYSYKEQKKPDPQTSLF